MPKKSKKIKKNPHYVLTYVGRIYGQNKATRLLVGGQIVYFPGKLLSQKIEART
jgi:hypothetical protein